MTSTFDEDDITGSLYEEDEEHLNTAKVFAKNIVPEKRKLKLVWRNVSIFAVLHPAALYGLFLCFTSAKLSTVFVGFILHNLGLLGVTAGVHRLWSHRSYKAKGSLRVFLLLCYTMAFQGSVIQWARDHRVHHKYTETDADPHNAKRGFFFAHMGWLLVRKHPDVTLKGKGLDLSDLYADPMLRFQERYYYTLVLLMCFVIPAVVLWFFWAETLHNAFFVCSTLRYCTQLHITWLINSGAHMWGHKPYDRYIYAVENKLLSTLVIGECWHNFHHSFPWVYKAEELGRWATNNTTLFLDACARLGRAYDLKSVSAEMVKRRVLHTGDGSHAIWGWGDKDQAQQEREEAIIIAKKKINAIEQFFVN